MRHGSVIERSEASGSPATVGDATFTPVARSTIIRWPGGGAAWSGPAAIIVEREGSTDRIPIVNVNRRILWGLKASAIALVATWIVHRRREEDSHGRGTSPGRGARGPGS
jgi:hypothetical protein